MKSSQPFTIYNASAGSGKTFTLVKSFLKKVLQHPQKGYYKHLLAITFTNKAVAEMKQRIITTLVGFSEETTPATHRDMFLSIQEETGLSSNVLKQRAATVLKHLLHHYAQFSVETIDHFNHRLIRTFAHDLKLASNFEVSLDIDELLSKAVDNLIERAGKDEKITKVLLQFALQKTEEDKSWDIAFDLRKAAKLLTKENEAPHLQLLKGRSLEDFAQFQKKIDNDLPILKEQLIAFGKEMVTSFLQNHLDRSHFSRGTVFDFFTKISEGEYRLKYDPAWHRDIDSKPLYPKKVTEAEAQTIDGLAPKISEVFNQIKELAHQILLLENIAKNLIPLATINLINQELQLIKEEENILPISEFNALIHKEIKDQPAPFIYERLGDRYRDFFIDEFQDTSKLQWTNLIPLIDNALSQFDEAEGSALLVGDAKQSIYRWRGGLPEQFIDLYGAETPFSISEKTVENLETNYRSAQEIVNFNNDFFSYLATQFSNTTHQELYTLGNQQKHTDKTGGYVKVEFLDTSLEEAYPEKIGETLKELFAKGYTKKEICILTRNKKDGVAISEFLLSRTPSIPILSEETLLLKNAKSVGFLVALLTLSIHPENEEIRMEVLDFLYTHLSIPEEQHSYYAANLSIPVDVFFDSLKNYQIDCTLARLEELPLYESFEYLIHCFSLQQPSDAMLFDFMDLVFRFSQRKESGKTDFLTHWESEKEKASLSPSNTLDAVRVMTIHKSKGLEFPVVIFPYADVNLYKQIDPIAWYPWHQDHFKEVLISYKNELEEYSEYGKAMVAQRKSRLELDAINLLYVALTRAAKALYIFADQKMPRDPSASYNGLLKSYLTTHGSHTNNSTIYEVGSLIDHSAAPSANDVSAIPYIVAPPQLRNIKLVKAQIAIENEDILAAIQLGNLLHDTMAKIECVEDVPIVLQELKENFTEDATTFNELEGMIKNLVNHPELSHLFATSEKVLNETDIITSEKIIRPDRINIHRDGTVTLLDYKTGAEKSSYHRQLEEYAQVLETMGYPIKEKLLLYCNVDGILINKT